MDNYAAARLGRLTGQTGGPTGTYEGLKLEIERLRAVNSALLEALENLVQMYPYAADTYAPWTEARAAIALAKGESA